MKKITYFVLNRFPLFVGLYLLFLVVIRLFMTKTAVLDEAEQVMLAQFFALGYNAQPPLYTWMQMSVFDIFGVSILGLSLLKNSLLALTYLCVYKTGILLTSNKIKAALGSLSLMLLPQIIWGSQIDQTHTVLLTTATALTCYFYFKIAVKEPRLLDFILLGLVTAIGILAKYNFVLVIFGLIGAGLLVPSYRQKFLDKRLLFAIIISGCVVAPHGVWFLSNMDLATSTTVERMSSTEVEPGNSFYNSVKGLSELAIATLAFISPFWLFFILFFRKKWSWVNNDQSKVLLYYVAIVFTILVVIIAGSDITNIKERWLQPYLMLFPLFLFMQTDIDRICKFVHRYTILPLVIALLVGALMLIKPMLIDFRGKPSRTNYPFENIANKLSSKLTKESIIWAEDKFIGGNIHLFLPETTVITPSLPLQPYKTSSNILLVYSQPKAPAKLLALNKQGYKCTNEIITESFTHSQDLDYVINVASCMLSKESTD